MERVAQPRRSQRTSPRVPAVGLEVQAEEKVPGLVKVVAVLVVALGHFWGEGALGLVGLVLQGQQGLQHHAALRGVALIAEVVTARRRFHPRPRVDCGNDRDGHRLPDRQSHRRQKMANLISTTGGSTLKMRIETSSECWSKAARNSSIYWQPIVGPAVAFLVVLS